MAKLAMLTTGPLFYQLDDARNMAYGELANKIFAELDPDKGFLGLSGMDRETSWGAWTIPKCYRKEEYEGRIIQTLSLWQRFRINGRLFLSWHPYSSTQTP